jgi:hypothetical protein
MKGDDSFPCPPIPTGLHQSAQGCRAGEATLGQRIQNVINPERIESNIESVRQYIAGQEEHHRRVSFQDEFRQFLKWYEIECDERYVWD